MVSDGERARPQRLAAIWLGLIAVAVLIVACLFKGGTKPSDQPVPPGTIYYHGPILNHSGDMVDENGTVIKRHASSVGRH